MINITSKSRYALKIMVDLAAHEQSGKQQRLDIAERQGIPPDYIDQILSRLRQSELVTSIRGRNGGFILGRPASEISVWDIFSAAEDTLYPVQCIESSNCLGGYLCSTRDIWLDLFSDLRKNLQKKTLAQLATLWKKPEDLAMMTGFETLCECKAPIKSGLEARLNEARR
ncbi:MAG: Rrf2 family transcriptional regulator [Bdellovibrionota bacterium]